MPTLPLNAVSIRKARPPCKFPRPQAAGSKGAEATVTFSCQHYSPRPEPNMHRPALRLILLTLSLLLAACRDSKVDAYRVPKEKDVALPDTVATTAPAPSTAPPSAPEAAP